MRTLSSILATLAGIVLICGLGWFLPGVGIGHALTRLSYGLPFLNVEGAPSDIVIVYMTDSDAMRLQQRGGVWRRSLHAKLIRTVMQQQPRAMLFDIVFSEPDLNPAEDPELADAIQQSGRVYLAGERDYIDHMEAIIPPLPMLRRVAAGWGTAVFSPIDEDQGVRYLYTGNEQVPTVTWRMAEKLGAPLPKTWEERKQERWIYYYGGVDCFTHCTYYQALHPDELPPDFFRDKIVIVGGRASIGGLRLGKDEFRHPFSGWQRRTDAEHKEEHAYIQGVELHATILANLLRGEWLHRLSGNTEYAVIIGYGLLLALLLPRLQPHTATFTAIGLASAMVAGVIVLFYVFRYWFAWCIPMVQTPVALGWAIGYRYFLVDRRRNKIRKAFTKYMSPHVLARLELDVMSLEPGGTIMDATIVFTDLEGFTTLSEELNDPKALSELLTWYFTRATTQVLENDGTILKYIGDSVFAVWGAPLADSRHPQKAARAACRMHAASEREIQGRRLRTRVGVHTGNVLQGNLGSLQQFDYTCIGDAVNLAARMEGLNKYLGTNVLISGDTHARIGDGFISRCLGEFQLAGRRKAVTVYELLGEKPAVSIPEYFEPFARALGAYHAGDFATATLLFQDSGARRGSRDGPSEFYLARIATLNNTAPQPWDPVVEMETK